ncbi:MAG TPA: 23S rRNA (adenine(2503)-C(2))-methyltransferase RlmN [Candidatus Didemnitutus sp.]
MSDSRASFHDLSRAAWLDEVSRWGFPKVHGARLWSYVYVGGVDAWSRMPDLPARFRAHAEERITLTLPPVATETHSSDGYTRKYLLSLGDGRQVESVLMRYAGRVTACISSQAGCAMGCVFCATGRMGFGRHLTAGEIVAQALQVDRELRAAGTGGALARPESPSAHIRHERLRNIVLMGMGEPLHNYDAVMAAIGILQDPAGLALGTRRITLSTVGVVPGIVRLADEDRPVHLAVSLHAASQAGRAALIPVAKRWPLDELMEACRYYIARRGRRIFYEWTLIAGINDSADHAHELGRLLQGQEAQVNLIPLNPVGGYDGEPTGRDAARHFQAVLTGYDLPSTIRQRRGIDIAAGCGQLAGAAP